MFTTVLRQALLSVCLVLLAPSVLAHSLPSVTGVSYDGSAINWDALPNATGYNVHSGNLQYLTTVRDTTSYTPTSSGTYYVAGFDDNGNYSPLLPPNNEGTPVSNFVSVSLFDTGLTPPANVRGTVYSVQAGEVFWDRVLSSDLQYDIYLNDAYLTTVSGTSVFIDSLLPNRNNSVAVLSRNNTGATSESISLNFDTSGSAYPSAAIGSDVVVVEGIPTTPQSARLVRYSSTAAELFWDKPSQAENIVTTEVRRDSALLGIAEGNSFYDGTRTPDAAHRYELIAINIDGRRSAPATINPMAFSGQPNDIVQRMMTGLTDITVNNPHRQWYPLIVRFASSLNLPEGVAEQSSFEVQENNQQITRHEFQCSAGTARVDHIATRYGQSRFEFAECSVNGNTLSGAVLVTFNLSGYLVEYQALRVNNSLSTSIMGSVRYNSGFPANSRLSLEFTDFEFNITKLGEASGLGTEALLNQSIIDDITQTPRSTYTTAISVSAPWTNGAEVTVTTTQPFANADLGAGNYTEGKLTMATEDGQRLELDVAFPDAAGWYATVVQTTRRTGIIGAWGGGIQLPCLSTTEGDTAIPNCQQR